MRCRHLRILLGLTLGLFTTVVAQGQGIGRGPGSSYGISPAAPDFGRGAAYLPYGANAGGFVPYRAGPGGGLGVQTRMRSAPVMAGAGGAGSMSGRAGPRLGRVRGLLTPLTPIRRAGAGMGGGSRILGRMAPAAGMSGSPARPPVGGYPFRQPPRPGGTAASSPAMSM